MASLQTEVHERPNCGKLFETPWLQTCYNCGGPSPEEVWRHAVESWSLWRTVALIMLAVITVLGLVYLFFQLLRAAG